MNKTNLLLGIAMGMLIGVSVAGSNPAICDSLERGKQRVMERIDRARKIFR